MQQNVQAVGTVLALAGRRVDAEGTNPPRFPLENVRLVRQRLAGLFAEERAIGLVCSAACGADLIALEEAERLGVRRRIVLPFQPERFRETSVVDRPGDWGPVFDQAIARAAAANDLIVLDGANGDNEAAYAAANEVIIDEALRFAHGGAPIRLTAVVVWEGAARPGIDASEDFRRLAVEAGFEERFVLTLTAANAPEKRAGP